MTTADNQLAHALRTLTAYPDRVVAVAREQGWRPPAREITTAEELEALPRWSVVVIDNVAVQRVDTDWRAMNAPTIRIASAALMQLRGRLLVVYVPTEVACPHDSRSGTADGRWRCDECGADCGPDTYLTEEDDRG